MESLITQLESLKKQKSDSIEKEKILDTINKEARKFFYFSISEANSAKKPIDLTNVEEFRAEETIYFDFYIPIQRDEIFSVFNLNYRIKAHIDADPDKDINKTVEVYTSDNWDISQLDATDVQTILNLTDIVNNKTDTNQLTSFAKIENIKFSDFLSNAISEEINQYLDNFAKNKGYSSRVLGVSSHNITYYNTSLNYDTETYHASTFCNRIKREFTDFLSTIKLSATGHETPNNLDSYDFQEFISYISNLDIIYNKNTLSKVIQKNTENTRNESKRKI